MLVLLANSYAACTTLRTAAAQGLTGEGYVWVGGDGFVASPLDCGVNTSVAINASIGAIGTAPGIGNGGVLGSAILAATLRNVSSTVVDQSRSDGTAIEGVNLWRVAQARSSQPFNLVSYRDAAGAVRRMAQGFTRCRPNACSVCSVRFRLGVRTRPIRDDKGPTGYCTPRGHEIRLVRGVWRGCSHRHTLRAVNRVSFTGVMGQISFINSDGSINDGPVSSSFGGW